MSPTVVGKFLHCQGERFWVKGVTYGPFAPAMDVGQFPSRERVAEDFAMMAQHGINTVRTYTAPGQALLDEAARHGLRVMVGLPWAQHVAFLDDRRLRERTRREIMAEVGRLASHPAVLLFALGNEIPAPVVRWLGAERVERFLRSLYDEAKSAAPDSLFTYVNFPPTEYLNLSFVDLFAFNVYLHRQADLRAYTARLQKIAAHKPLLVAEAGADSLREGEDGQAALTAMQVRTAFAEGACGAIAFNWTDEWWRGGSYIEDWAFGLVDRARRPKPTLQAVAGVFAAAPFPEIERRTWPQISVVVCTYNGADTLDECLTSLERLTYPDVEIILVNDGSTDDTGAIAARHPGVRRIDVPNGGLGAARNVGLEAATGGIVAYTDADVRADPDWLTYLVQPFLTADVAAAGGPNVVPPDDSWVAQCVARAPGGPTHVLLDDRIAEHVPGCNMAFRREALLAIGGFNPIYVRAGDDVDMCWRLQARGWKIGFAPSALVWHRHRPSISQYWRQQVGYAEGQVWLMPHHPDKFVGGKIQWRGLSLCLLAPFGPLAGRFHCAPRRRSLSGAAPDSSPGRAARGHGHGRAVGHGIPVLPLLAGLRLRVAALRSTLAQPRESRYGYCAHRLAALHPAARASARPDTREDALLPDLHARRAPCAPRASTVDGRSLAHRTPAPAARPHVVLLVRAMAERGDAAHQPHAAARPLAAGADRRDRPWLADRLGCSRGNRRLAPAGRRGPAGTGGGPRRRQVPGSRHAACAARRAALGYGGSGRARSAGRRSGASGAARAGSRRSGPLGDRSPAGGGRAGDRRDDERTGAAAAG